MDLKQLRNIVAVANSKSFGKAARELSISQPALSISIKNLEREVGSAMFIRSRKEAIPTEFGSNFIAHARSVLHEAEKARELVRESKAGRTRTVRVGVDSIVANLIAASVMPRFIDSFPQTRVEFEVATGTLPEAMAHLSSGEWDFGVVLIGRMSIIPPNYTARKCAQLTTGPHARLGHPLAGGPAEVPLAELAAQRWVLSTRNDGRSLIAACGKHGFDKPEIVARTNSFEALMKLIEATDCVTFLPFEILQYTNDVHLVPLHNSELLFRTSVIILQANDIEVTPPAYSLAKLIAECLQALH